MASGGPVRLAFDRLTVDFGPTRALDDLSLEIAPGEIVGLLGHNGAGKSTLLNVASGAVEWTRGAFAVDGQQIAIGASPSSLAARGLTIIHQEPALAGNLSVLRNLYLATGNRDDQKTRRTKAAEALARVGLDVDLNTPVEILSLGERQLVDLARGVLRGGVTTLLLDEPTAALGAAETAALHALIRDFAAQGTGVVYVSHRLPDILDVCTRIVVLREGRLVMDEPSVDLDVTDLAKALAPELTSNELVVQSGGEKALTLVHGDRELVFRDGEVVGLFGMAAGEQFGLLSSLFGDGPAQRAELRGASYRPRRPLDAIRAGVYLVPSDREKDGLISGMSAAENVNLPWHRLLGRRWWVSRSKPGSAYTRARNALNVRGPEGSEPIAEFSGGNRQKHLLARWTFPSRPSLLLLAQPTQGVDVAAKQDIATVVRELASESTCVIVGSAESDEIVALCDRAYVLYNGRSAELQAGPDFSGRLLQTLLDLSQSAEAPTARTA